MKKVIKEFVLIENEEDTQEVETSVDPTSTQELEVWTRTTINKEYVKVIVRHGKVIGALLIGDTEMEEVMENLILNKLDVSRYGIDLLDPNFDMEEYFD